MDEPKLKKQLSDNSIEPKEDTAPQHPNKKKWYQQRWLVVLVCTVGIGALLVIMSLFVSAFAYPVVTADLKDNTTTDQPSITIKGNVSPPESKLSINNKDVAVSGSGDFSQSFDLQEGDNTVTLAAIYPKSNNKTAVTLHVHRQVKAAQAQPAISAPKANHPLTDLPGFTLRHHDPSPDGIFYQYIANDHPDIEVFLTDPTDKNAQGHWLDDKDYHNRNSKDINGVHVDYAYKTQLANLDNTQNYHDNNIGFGFSYQGQYYSGDVFTDSSGNSSNSDVQSTFEKFVQTITE